MREHTGAERHRQRSRLKSFSNFLLVAGGGAEPAAGEERRQWLEDQVGPYGTRASKDAIDYLNPQLHLVKGKATYNVPELAEDLTADLVIMGTQGRS